MNSRFVLHQTLLHRIFEGTKLLIRIVPIIRDPMIVLLCFEKRDEGVVRDVFARLYQTFVPKSKGVEEGCTIHTVIVLILICGTLWTATLSPHSVPPSVNIVAIFVVTAF